ncbi:MAG: tryptophan--tRNA ligase [Candidatus Harrisonbacteria bacterium]|nr:tryptophan--tRNA ligase [Candidatus Harrisonbacteria bacterium]
MKPVLISGIQPTGRLHLGNYLGALKNFVDLQNSGKYNCHFFIADLHSLTEEFVPKEKPHQIIELAANYIAAGLNPKKSLIFLQSQVSAHTELSWILNSITPFGELRRMTQFKEKSGSHQESANVGLFTYPVLMAADILLYDANQVPVGEDQLQHLELARTLARKFNKKFGSIFREPQALMTETPRIMSLDDPTKKMSKSRSAGCLFIDDSPEVINQKIRGAVTDSGSKIAYNPKEKPAVSNMLMIYKSLSGESMEKIERQFGNRGYFEFKKAFAKLVASHFAPLRRKKMELLKKPAKIKKILQRGSAQAARISGKKIAEVKEKIGLAI